MHRVRNEDLEWHPPDRHRLASLLVLLSPGVDPVHRETGAKGSDPTKSLMAPNTTNSIPTVVLIGMSQSCNSVSGQSFITSSSELEGQYKQIEKFNKADSVVSSSFCLIKKIHNASPCMAFNFPICAVSTARFVLRFSVD